MGPMTAEQVWRSLSPGERQRYLDDAHERTPHRPEEARDIARELALADARRDARVIGAIVDDIRSADVRGISEEAIAGALAEPIEYLKAVGDATRKLYESARKIDAHTGGSWPQGDERKPKEVPQDMLDALSEACSDFERARDMYRKESM